MQTTVTLNFDNTSSAQQSIWLQHTLIDKEFLITNWSKFSSSQKTLCIIHQQLDDAFIEKEWSKLPEYHQSACISGRKYSHKLLVTFWKMGTIDIKKVILDFQTLEGPFLQQVWDQIPDDKKGKLFTKSIFDTDFTHRLMQTECKTSVVSHQPLNEQDFLAYLTTCTTKLEKTLLLSNPKIDVEHYVKHWELLTDDNKGVVLSTQCQKFTASWIREHWGELKETESMLSICLKWQIVPIDILKEVWHTLTSQQKALIVKLQAMDRALITTALNEGWEDLLVNYQQISKKQFLSVWEKLPKQTKTHAFRIQQCVKKLTLEELPIFLTDENMDVRKHTNILYKQLIKKGRT